jgi:hypothetical protein
MDRLKKTVISLPGYSCRISSSISRSLVKPAATWVPSQKGLVPDCPQVQSMAGFGASTVSPSRTRIGFSLCSIRGPLSRGVILLAIACLSRGSRDPVAPARGDSPTPDSAF